MTVKMIKLGKAKLYVFLDDFQGRESALKLCRKFGYDFYPRATIQKKFIVTECYNGNLLCKVKLRKDAVCTVGQSLCDSLEFVETELEIPEDDIKPETTVLKEIKQSIKDSKLVFIAGRGIGSKANYDRLKKLAEKFGAATGCSRPVAMNGWESYDNCVGISGNLLECDTVVCFGASGTEPFMKGIENCKTIIAVNKDKKAMIFKKSDYGIADDCMNVISYLENL